MTCQVLSDRMPLVALGQATWSDEQRRHLAQCADCSAEWRVVEQASRAVSTSPPGLDPELIGARVLHRLSTEPVPSQRSPRWWLAGAGIAAAAALALVVLKPGGPGVATAPLQSALELPMAELDSLDNDQLRLVLESIDEPLETPTMNEAPSMLDLDDQQLERVLGTLEG